MPDLSNPVHIAVLSVVFALIAFVLTLAQRLGDWRSKAVARALGILSVLLIACWVYLAVLWIFEVDLFAQESPAFWTIIGIVSLMATGLTLVKWFRRNEPSQETINPGSPSAHSAKRFRVALSFPGEHRARVERVAELLASRLGRENILFDKWLEPEFNRQDLDIYLQDLYRNESELVAVFACEEYRDREWCGLEWRAIRDLMKRKESPRVMRFRFDDADIPGILSIDGYQDARKMSDSEVAQAILSESAGSIGLLQARRSRRRTLARKVATVYGILASVLLLLFVCLVFFLWQRHKAREIVSARASFEEGEVLSLQHTPESITLAIEKLGNAIKSDPTLAAAHAQLATIYLFDRDDMDLSFKHACLAMKNSHNDWHIEATSLTLLGTLNRNRGQLTHALPLFEQALDAYVKHHDLRGQISAHNNLAVTYQSLMDKPSAIKHHRVAVEFSKKLGDPIAQFRSQKFLGDYYYGLSVASTESAEKEQRLTDALVEYTQASDLIAGKRPTEEAELLASIGNIYLDRRQWIKAESSYRHAIRLAAPSHASRTEALAYNSLGNTYKLQERWTEAMDEYDRAWRLFKADSSGVGLFASNRMTLAGDTVNVLRSMEDVTMRIPDYKKAMDYCDAEALLDPDSTAPDYQRACIYCLMGDAELALREFQKVKLDVDWADHAEHDSDLKCLRGNPVFIERVRKGKTVPPNPGTAIGAKSPPLICPK